MSKQFSARKQIYVLAFLILSAILMKILLSPKNNPETHQEKSSSISETKRTRSITNPDIADTKKERPEPNTPRIDVSNYFKKIENEISDPILFTGEVRERFQSPEFLNITRRLFQEQHDSISNRDIIFIIENYANESEQSELYSYIIGMFSDEIQRLDALSDLASDDDIRIKMKQRVIIELSRNPDNYDGVLIRIKNTDNDFLRSLYISSAISTMEQSTPSNKLQLKAWQEFLLTKEANGPFIDTYKTDINESIDSLPE